MSDQIEQLQKALWDRAIAPIDPVHHRELQDRQSERELDVLREAVHVKPSLLQRMRLAFRRRR